MSGLALAGIASMLFVIWFTQRAYRNNTKVIGYQTGRQAIVEAWVNIVIGLSMNFCVNLILLPLMTQGGHVSLSSNWWGGWIFTVVSIVRQYCIRRNAHRIERFTAWVAFRLSCAQLFVAPQTEKAYSLFPYQQGKK